METENNTGEVKAAANIAERPILLRSTADRLVLKALTSLEQKKFVGMPKLKDIANEICLLGFGAPDESNISRSLDRLEKMKFISRLTGFKVLAQEGGMR